MLQGNAAFLHTADFAKLGYLNGMRDKRDLSYTRPLDMEDGEHERW